MSWSCSHQSTQSLQWRLALSPSQDLLPFISPCTILRVALIWAKCSRHRWLKKAPPEQDNNNWLYGDQKKKVNLCATLFLRKCFITRWHQIQIKAAALVKLCSCLALRLKWPTKPSASYWGHETGWRFCYFTVPVTILCTKTQTTTGTKSHMATRRELFSSGC